jgi:hypothetical protein
MWGDSLWYFHICIQCSMIIETVLLFLIPLSLKLHPFLTSLQHLSGFHCELFMYIYMNFDHVLPHTLFSSSHLLLAPPSVVPPFYVHVLFYIWEKICDICLSKSLISLLTWWSQAPSNFPINDIISIFLNLFYI